ncbi:hypothetical protein V1522DRAFT_408734 [Lipomyces starkeyi]
MTLHSRRCSNMRMTLRLVRHHPRKWTDSKAVQFSSNHSHVSVYVGSAMDTRLCEIMEEFHVNNVVLHLPPAVYVAEYEIG